MVNSYDDIMGEPMDVDTHPARNKPNATQHFAGDVVPMRPDSPTVNDYAADRQIINQRSMAKIATEGPKAVDPRNLIMFPRK